MAQRQRKGLYSSLPVQLASPGEAEAGKSLPGEAGEPGGALLQEEEGGGHQGAVHHHQEGRGHVRERQLLVIAAVACSVTRLQGIGAFSFSCSTFSFSFTFFFL